MTFKIYLLVFVLFFTSFAIAQNAPNKTDAAGKKQGHWSKYDDKHKKIYDGNFVDDYPVGKFIYYYDTGVQRSVTVFSEKGKVARAKMYDPGGKLTGEGKYVDQKKDSLWKFYDMDGRLISDETYVNGVKNGNFSVYYENGQLAEEKMWKDGKLNGPVKKYFDNGQLKYNGQMIDDKLEGKTTFYYSSGKVDAEGIYLHDVKDGEWRYYNEDGSIKRIGKFSKGMDLTPDKSKDFTKEDEEKAKKEYENSEIKDPFGEGYTPPK